MNKKYKFFRLLLKMFYEVEIEDIVRIPPNMLKENEVKTIEEVLRKVYIGTNSKTIGTIISVVEILSVGEGIVIPEDGGVYYKVRFKVISFYPEVGELVYGIVSSIADFGVFLNIGPVDGLVHVSQVMDDEVVISGRDALMGKNTKKVLKVGDLVRARVITVSYKDITNVRIGLTMKQPGLGKLEWLEEKQTKKKK